MKSLIPILLIMLVVGTIAGYSVSSSPVPSDLTEIEVLDEQREQFKMTDDMYMFYDAMDAEVSDSGGDE